MGNTVFISWSGERSRYVAEALRDWLPVVLQTVKPWMSAADVEKGSRWESEISARLDEADIGIVCLTPENLSSPWLLFEAGALSKKLSKSRVCTYLVDLTPAEVPPPMGMFQHTVFGRDDTRKLLDSINNAQAHPIGKEILDTSFGALWPSLEGKFKDIPPVQEPAKPARSLNDMMEELLGIVRGLPSLLDAHAALAEAQATVAKIVQGLRAGLERGRLMEEEARLRAGLPASTQPGQFDPFRAPPCAQTAGAAEDQRTKKWRNKTRHFGAGIAGEDRPSKLRVLWD